MATTKGVELWERQPNESPQAWEAFLLYRDMGAERSIRTVAQKLGKSSTLIARWSSNWEWQKRTTAYDNELAREEFEKARKERREMNRRHINLSLRLQKAAAEALEAKDFTQMSDKDIVSFIRLAQELERTARGDDREVLATEAGEDEGASGPTVQIILPDNGRMRRQTEDE